VELGHVRHPVTVSPLISVEDLRARVGAVTVLDVRYRLGGPPGRPEYAAGHVPGAAFVDLDQALADPPGSGGRHPLPDPGRFGAAMRAAGVSATRPVVVYDDSQGLAAGRAWWLLRHHGHPDVRVLDGGWAAWTSTGAESEAGEATPEPGDFQPGPGVLPLLDAHEVLRTDILIDARAPERYRGESEPIDPVAGHIPGALNVPTSTNLGADGRFRSPEQLRALYAAAGVPVDGPVHDPVDDSADGSREDAGQIGVYCGSGVTAIHDIIALEILGVPAALYAGSWSGWITDPDRPIERS
jgi:thiosulfate/3-mercaptopyruvate sulfurtransferase